MRGGASGRTSAPQYSLPQGIMETGEVEALYKADIVRESVCIR